MTRFDGSSARDRATRATRVEVAAELADLAGRSEEATTTASRRLLHAVVITLVGPVMILAQAPLFWSDGWPAHGLPALGIAVVLAAILWGRWAPAHREAKHHRSLFDDRRTASSTGRKRFISTGSLWSIRRA